MPYSAGVDFDYTLFEDNTWVTIDTFAKLESQNAQLQTRFPVLEFTTDLVVDLSGTVGAEGCVGIPFIISKCAGASYDFDLGRQTVTLISINEGGSGEVLLVPDLQQILGAVTDSVNRVREKDPVTGKTKKKLVLAPPFAEFGSGPIISAEVSLPDFETTYTPMAGLDSLTTDTNGETFLDLNVDIDGLMTAAGLLPPLEINVELGTGIASVGLHANLLDVDLDAALSVEQSVTLTSNLLMDVSFDREVTVRVNGGVADTLVAGQKILNLSAGTDSFEILWDEGAGPLQINPEYHLNATLANLTSVDLGLTLGIEVLSASASVSIAGYDAGSVGFGPLIDKTYDLNDLLGTPSIEVFNSEFALEGFQSVLFGNIITLDTTGAIFTGQGANTSWRDNANWVGVAPDGGLDVVIDLQNVPGSSLGPTVQPTDTGTNSVSVGDVTVGAGASIVVLGTLNQAAGATRFSNAGQVTALGIPAEGWDGTLGIATPVDGGGTIALISGTLNATSSAGLDLQGQDVVGIANSVINVENVFKVDDKSFILVVISETGSPPGPITITPGILDLNVTNNSRTVNEGIIGADNGTLNWTATSNQTEYVIDNAAGQIIAFNNGLVSIDHCGSGDPTCNTGQVRVLGGTLATDETSQINFAKDLALSGTVHIDGNVEVDPGQVLRLGSLGGSTSTFEYRLNELVNDGSLTFSDGLFLDGVTTKVSGTGTAFFNGSLKNTPGGFGGQFINGENHTFSGSGQVSSGAVAIVNEGTFTASSATDLLTIQTGVGFSKFTNTGTLSATGAGGLRFVGELRTDQGNVTASGGDIALAGFVTGGSTTGPGGVWTAINSTISLEDGANQWQSLANDFSELNGGEIVLIGNNSDFVVNGTSIEDNFDGIDAIGITGKLTLVNKFFDRSDLLIGGAATILINGTLELVNSEIDTGSVCTGIVCVPTRLGRLNIGTTGTVKGDGTIDSNIFNNGLVRAEGGTLTIEGDITGFGTFAAGNGARLELDLGHCTILGFVCPFARNVVAAGQVDGNRFVVDSIDAVSTLQLTGTGTNPFISNLSGAEIQLNGALARVSLVSTTLGTRTLGQTLQTLDASTLALSGGNDFVSSNTVSLTNGSALQMADSTTAYTGPALNVLSGSAVAMSGGTLDVNSLTLGAGTTLEGFGTVTGPAGPGNTIGNAGSIVANDGVLEIANSTINQTGAGNLEADDVVYAIGVPEAQSELRLTDTTVNGGTVRVGVGAGLTGNGKFNDVAATNAGTILADDTGDAVTAFTNSTIDNQSGSLVQVSNATLALNATAVTNAADAEIQIRSETTDLANSVVQLAGSTITGGTVELNSAPEVTLIDSGVVGVPAERIESAPVTQAILAGYGTLTDVNLVVDAFSMVDANVLDERLTFDIGTGSITNLGLMRASDGGILTLSTGTIRGTGDVLALAGSVVEIHNMVFDGVSLSTEGDGVILDVASSTFTNLANSGTFEVAGVVTVIGNLNNVGGLIRILDGGTIVLADGAILNPPPDPVPDPMPPPSFSFPLDGGTMLIDALGVLDGNGNDFVAFGATVGGSGLIDANVSLMSASTLTPGGDGVAGTLVITGDLTTSADSSIIFDIFNGTFDKLQLSTDGLFDFGGTVILNFMEDLLLDPFTTNFSIFNLFLGVSEDFSLFGSLMFEGLWSTGSASIALLPTNSGFFSITDIVTNPSTSVPEPGTLWLMLAAFPALFVIRRRSKQSARQ